MFGGNFGDHGIDAILHEDEQQVRCVRFPATAATSGVLHAEVCIIHHASL